MNTNFSIFDASDDMTWETPMVMSSSSFGFRRHCYFTWRNGRRVRICRFVRRR